MRTSLACLVAAALAASAGGVQAKPVQGTANQPTSSARLVYVCEPGQMNFISAEGLARAQAANEAWASPRCMTERELARYEKTRQGGRVIYICDQVVELQRAWGWSRLTPVSAEELARAQTANEKWATPRCISERNLQRYEQSTLVKEQATTAPAGR